MPKSLGTKVEVYACAVLLEEFKSKDVWLRAMVVPNYVAFIGQTA
jgi:hypothetical protein